MNKSRLFLAIFLSLLILTIGIYLFGNYKIKRSIAKQFETMPSASYDDCEVSFINGNIKLFDVQLDTRRDSTQKYIGTTFFKLVEISGLSWKKLIFDKKLEATSLLLDSPIANIQEGKKQQQEEKASEKENGLSCLAFQEIILKNGSLRTYAKKDSTRTIKSIDKINITVKDFEFDKNKQEQKIQIAELEAVIENVFLQGKDELHNLKIAQIHFDHQDLIAQDLSFTSPHSVDDFFTKIEVRKNRFDLIFPEVRLAKIKLPALISGDIFAQSLHLEKPQIKIFTDKNVPPKDFEVKALPIAALQNLSSTLHIDTVKINKAEVLYSLRQKDRQERGEVFWKEVNGTLTNLSNDSQTIEQNPNLNAQINSQFMGTSRFDLTATFLLNSPNQAYSYTGQLDAFNLQETNQIFEDVTRIKILRGDLQELSFDVKANDKNSVGTLNFYYDNLKVKMDARKNGRKRKIINWLVEKVIVKESNLPNETNKQGTINTFRKRDKGMFNQMWNAILDGLKDVMI